MASERMTPEDVALARGEANGAERHTWLHHQWLRALDEIEAAWAEIERLEQLVCDFQAAGMIDVGGQGGPCRVEPKHIEQCITALRAERDAYRSIAVDGDDDHPASPEELRDILNDANRREGLAQSASYETGKRLDAATAEAAALREALKPFVRFLDMPTDCDCDHSEPERTITVGDTEHSDSWEVRDCDGELRVGLLRRASAALARPGPGAALLERVKALEAVAKYANHAPSCRWQDSERGWPADKFYPCSCGLDEAKSALAAPPAGHPEPSREGGGPGTSPAPAPAASDVEVAGAAERLQGAPQLLDDDADAFEDALISAYSKVAAGMRTDSGAAAEMLAHLPSDEELEAAADTMLAAAHELEAAAASDRRRARRTVAALWLAEELAHRGVMLARRLWSVGIVRAPLITADQMREHNDRVSLTHAGLEPETMRRPA